MLIDILLALSFAAMLITVGTEALITNRNNFERSTDRAEPLSYFGSSTLEVIPDLILKTNQNADSNIQSTAKLRGNNQNENTLILSTGSNNFDPYIFNQVDNHYAANYFEFAGKALCSVDFFANQSKNISISQITLPINPMLSLTDLEVRNNIAYLSADPSNGTDPTLLIADIFESNSPKILSSIRSGPGLSYFSLIGNEIFGAALSQAAQLDIVKINSLNQPILEKRYKLPLPFATATPPMATAIDYKGNMIFLGTEKWSGDEFNIIDVSNSSAPNKIAGLEIGAKVNSVLVENGLAYIAAADQMQLRVIDIHDPYHPILVNSFSPSGWQRQEGKSLSLFENRLEFGRTSGGYNITSDHELFSWATTSLASLVQPISMDISGGVYGIVSDRSHYYIASRQNGHEFQIYDSTLTASSTAFDLPILPQTMTCDRNHLFVLASTAPVIYEINFD